MTAADPSAAAPSSGGGGFRQVAPVALPTLPPRKGCYLLLLEVARATTLAVGRFGPLEFGAGLYLYAGSAHGPGGLAARLKHHLGGAARCHWHIDYLRLRAPVAAVWAAWGASAGHLNECRLAARLARQAPLEQPFKGFGSSDCTCFSHLLHWPAPVDDATPFSFHRTHAMTHLDIVLPQMVRLWPVPPG